MTVQVEVIYTRDRMECFRRTVEAGSLIVSYRRNSAVADG
jgi:hypothetical protein